MSVPAISMPILRMFRRIVRGYFRRHFHGVRMSGGGPAAPREVPLIVYANHSSWWDPMVAFLLAERLMPDRQHYAPMDAAALQRYALLKRLGVFPVETNSPRGAVQFLRTGRAVLDGGGVLWVTPQGQFVDARERPLIFKPGLAALAVRSAPCNVLPLAIEYPFWDERTPECLVRFGTAVAVEAADDVEVVEARLREALQREMDALHAIAVRRDAGQFATLTEGTAGTGGFYALGKRLKAFVLRRPYRAEHTAVKDGGAKG